MKNQIAKTAHAIHRAYCKGMNLKTQPSWEEISTEHRATILSTVNMILSGEIKSIEQSHKNFINFKKSNGWVYGDEYSLENKTNPRLIDNFNELPLHDRIKESLFFECVKSFM